MIDPFHVVCFAGDVLDQFRGRIQQQFHGHRGRAGGPLYTSRGALHTAAGLLTDRQWAPYQRMITAYRNPDRSAGGRDLAALIESLRTGDGAHCPGRTTQARPHPQHPRPPRNRRFQTTTTPSIVKSPFWRAYDSICPGQGLASEPC
jgi:Transposase